MHPISELKYFTGIYAMVSCPTEFFFQQYPKMAKTG
jgi:hypothetical protein